MNDLKSLKILIYKVLKNIFHGSKNCDQNKSLDHFEGSIAT